MSFNEICENIGEIIGVEATEFSKQTVEGLIHKFLSFYFDHYYILLMKG